LRLHSLAHTHGHRPAFLNRVGPGIHAVCVDSLVIGSDNKFL